MDRLGRQQGWTVGAAAVALILTAASGCSDDGGGLTGRTPRTEDGLRETARAQLQAFIDSPGQTYDFLSERCQDELTRSEWAGEMILAAGFFESFMGFELSDAQLGEIEVLGIEGDHGEVRVELLDPDGRPVDDEADPVGLIYEGDRWVSDDCETFEDSGFTVDEE